MKRKIIHVIILFISMTVFSQNNEIGVFIGGSNYIGDVGPTTYINPFKYNGSRLKLLETIGTETTFYSLGLIYRKNFNSRISARFKINYANIGSDDKMPSSDLYRQERGKSFQNTILEYGLGIDFNFIDFDVLDSSIQMTPYINTGISLFSSNLLRYKKDISSAEKYGSFYNYSIPITIGYKIKPFQSFIIGFEITANATFTDNLDGNDPHENAIIAPLYDEAFGSTLSNDWYVFSGITLTYLFGNKKCYCPN